MNLKKLASMCVAAALAISCMIVPAFAAEDSTPKSTLTAAPVIATAENVSEELPEGAKEAEDVITESAAESVEEEAVADDTHAESEPAVSEDQTESKPTEENSKTENDVSNAAAPVEKKSHTGMYIGIAAAIVVVIGLVAVLNKNGNKKGK